MGTPLPRSIRSLLLGSVAEKVVRKAHCPGLTLRQPGHAFVKAVAAGGAGGPPS